MGNSTSVSSFKSPGRTVALPTDRGKYNVFEKLKKTEQFGRLPEELQKKQAVVLADVHEFRRTYFPQTKEQKSNFDEMVAESKKLVERDGELEANDKNMMEHTGKRIEDAIVQQKTTPWKLKLILTDMQMDSRVPAFFIPVVVQAGKLRNVKYGVVHAALQIGPWVVDWNTESLVVPRTFWADAAIIAVDIGEVSEVEMKEEIIAKLCQIIVQWNTEKYYNVINCNCQDFVDSVLAGLGIQTVFNGVIGEHLKKIQHKNDLKFGFEYSPDDKSEPIIFTTHKDLDEYLHDNGQKLSKDHLSLLKAFDRAFWLRYKALDVRGFWGLTPEEQEEKKNYAPLEGLCYFKDPEFTGTIIPKYA